MTSCFVLRYGDEQIVPLLIAAAFSFLSGNLNLRMAGWGALPPSRRARTAVCVGCGTVRFWSRAPAQVYPIQYSDAYLWKCLIGVTGEGRGR